MHDAVADEQVRGQDARGVDEARVRDHRDRERLACERAQRRAVGQVRRVDRPALPDDDVVV